MKLAVVVVEASDLMPKDGRGASNPFVEVDFAGQRRRTVTIFRELNPVWNDTLLFDLTDLAVLHSQTIDVSVYHDKAISTPYVSHRNFLGRVRISGAAVASSLAEAPLQRCLLDKRRLLSNIRGNIILRIHLFTDPTLANPAPADPAPEKESHKLAAENRRVLFPVLEEEKKAPTQTANRVHAAPPPPARHPPPHYGLVETSQQLAGQLGPPRPMYYLYVNVVKAHDLPSMDLTGSLNPYVEVKLGSYKGVTKAMGKNQSPVWNQVFAFSKEGSLANLLEVTVKDKDFVKDDFVGKILFDLADVPMRVRRDAPLAPQWYGLEDRKQDKTNRGEIMLAVWMGTQADESFPEAWHSDAHTRSKVYFSPQLTYLRVHVIQAQDLVPGDNSRPPDTYVKVQLGNQLRRTRPSPARSVNPIWSEELMLVASEPYDEPLVITVEDHIGPGKDELLGRLVLPVSVAQKRGEHPKPVEAQWFNLSKPNASSDEAEKKKEAKFSSKIHLRVYLDTGYHVLDECTYHSSDFSPAKKNLRKSRIGILELGILGARNLIATKARGSDIADPYCVAKYGPKWVRTRTVLHTVAPRWNEQCTWEVFDPCTVVTIGVFDNWNINTGSGGNSGSARDRYIGKVRIRLSTLEADRIYTHYYPLLVLLPSGLKKTGELHLCVRFTCTAWVNMVALYAKPLLPKMHYIQPIPVLQLDYLRHQAMYVVGARLANAEPPLRLEVVEYMLDVDSRMWSFRRSNAHFYRITGVLSGAAAIAKWFDSIRNWKNPVTTMLVHVLFLILVYYPGLILPAVFFCLFMIGVWNYRMRPRHPSHMDTKLSLVESAHPDELDEEFDTFPTSKKADLVRMRYDRLRSLAGRMQTVMGDLATQGERALALISRRDPRATAICTLFALIFAVFFLVMPFQVIVMLVGMYLLRHPKFRTKIPSVPLNFYTRLTGKSDMLF